MLVVSEGRRPSQFSPFFGSTGIYFDFFQYGRPQYSHLSTSRWSRDVRNWVNTCLDDHLLKLQKLTLGMVDLRYKNINVIPFDKFRLKYGNFVLFTLHFV
jgi:hypothetical protein